MRPKYAALNHARLDHGSAGQWGKSFMVLKEHVKQTATCLHTESFDEAGSAPQVRHAGGQGRHVHQHGPADCQHAAEQGIRHPGQTQVPGLGSTSYIEAHVHGEIRFDRAIARIVLSNTEIAEARIKTAVLEQQGKPFRTITSDKLTSIFTKFSAKYGIPVQRV